MFFNQENFPTMMIKIFSFLNDLKDFLKILLEKPLFLWTALLRFYLIYVSYTKKYRNFVHLQQKNGKSLTASLIVLLCRYVMLLQIVGFVVISI